MSGGLRRELPGLSVLSPPSVPLPTLPFARALNAQLYARSIDRALASLGHREPPILWVYTPTVARYLPRLRRGALVYHCVDRWWAFEDYDADEMRACHEILCREADLVFASAKLLEDDCRQFTDRVRYLPHGVEWAHFRRALTETAPRPADLPGGPYDARRLADRMRHDKKNADGSVTLILAKGIGNAYIRRGIEADRLAEFLEDQIA